DGYLMRRRPFFMGKPICHGTIATTWHLRFFRAGCGRCEGRLYDQHFLCDGRYGKLRGQLLDLQLASIESWTSSHNRWSTAEAHQALLEDEGRDLLPARFFGDPRMRRRWIKKHVWYRAPLFIRPLLFFLYRYIFKLGFLDGRHGIVYHVLQTFWYRFLVDAKLLEREQAKQWKSDLVRSLEEGF
ncbi:MAG TPA: hypothetical protein VGE01_01700, partial [Fimbriimonas sp.]